MEKETNIDKLFTLDTFSNDAISDKLFFNSLKDELIFHYENNEMYKQFCIRKNFNPYTNFSLEDIPPVSVSVFKELGKSLSSVPQDEIKLTLQSSATSGIPSSIVVDKITAKRQSKAMIRVIEEVIGHQRKPFLIMDIDPKSEFKQLLGARFAAVTGYLKFASKVAYFLKVKENNISYFDIEAMKTFIDSLDRSQPVVLFGFTYILYANVLKGISSKNIKIQLPKGSQIIHIGGWKKLESEKISKDKFNIELAHCFGIEPSDIIDIYGFTEQMGLNYPDMKDGWKHCSVYSKVIVRDVVTHEVLPAGKEGMLEFISPIPHSYPGNVILTDDLGVIDPNFTSNEVGGERFKVLGRIKKAEVRGCGDILSQKLTFVKKREDKVVDNHLQVLLHAESLKASDPLLQLQELIVKLKAKQEWLRHQPTEALIGLIAEVAKKWSDDTSLAFLKDKGLLFLSSWCDYNHLSSMAHLGIKGNYQYLDQYLAFPNSEKHMLRANAHGLVCHWLAGNVQILGLFALVQSIISKNVNLLKVSSRDNGVFETILNSFKGVCYKTAQGYTITGDDLLDTIGLIYFSHHADLLGEEMSKQADVRIAWGGKSAVETVCSYPTKFDAETIIFGPKLSCAVIAKEMLTDESAVKKLARRISVDVSVFDQTGCASPHNLFIEKGSNISIEKFVEALAKAMERTEKQIPKGTVSQEEISAIHSIRGVYDFKGKVIGSPTMSWTLLIDTQVKLANPIYSRTLFIHPVENLMEVIPLLNEDIQTVGLAASNERAISFADAAAQRGVARCPQLGRMLNFEMPWDGIFLFDRLVRWSTLGGPLR